MQRPFSGQRLIARQRPRITNIEFNAETIKAKAIQKTFAISETIQKAVAVNKADGVLEVRCPEKEV